MRGNKLSFTNKITGQSERISFWKAYQQDILELKWVWSRLYKSLLSVWIGVAVALLKGVFFRNPSVQRSRLKNCFSDNKIIKRLVVITQSFLPL